ncbi:hypothetical protein LIPSTDRAFT_186921 [Lipomyces starkeyi NRRL Y-11557]|uniref:Uncharacterized protein n=1 Tax=Lipomyces starkeyi NRRL Y-11557 TaxID=675824 RepID=A0A1E3PX32_LIPST|nr:hypothetical protein LIPSTDRAFT_186921 [Lipomyces starkeyi NRRL Y-11557]
MFIVITSHLTDIKEGVIIAKSCILEINCLLQHVPLSSPSHYGYIATLTFASASLALVSLALESSAAVRRWAVVEFELQDMKVDPPL